MSRKLDLTNLSASWKPIKFKVKMCGYHAKLFQKTKGRLSFRKHSKQNATAEQYNQIGVNVIV